MSALDTERLHLREPIETDGPALLAYHVRNEPRFAPWEPPLYEDVAAYVRWVRWRQSESIARRGFSFLAFDRAQPGALAGIVNVYAIERDASFTATLGYNFDGAYEGRGLAGEAVRATVAHTFAAHGVKKMLAYYNPVNERSGALLRRLGFVVEGYSRDGLYLRGSWRDHIQAALINPDWVAPPF